MVVAKTQKVVGNREGAGGNGVGRSGPRQGATSAVGQSIYVCIYLGPGTKKVEDLCRITVNHTQCLSTK